MTITSPAAKFGFMPPAAFETISISMPSAFITRTGKRGLLGRVAFVAMEAALHGDDRHAAERAAQQAAMMAYGRGAREMRQVDIGELLLNVDRIGHGTEP